MYCAWLRPMRSRKPQQQRCPARAASARARPGCEGLDRPVCRRARRARGAPARGARESSSSGSSAPVRTGNHRHVDATLARRGDGFGIPGVRVPDDPNAGIAREHALQLLVRFARAVGHDDHSGVQRVADADAAAVMDRRPTSRPHDVLSRAFSTGQSAIASLPSRIPSVSRLGEATDPVSRWSRPITIGALTTPRRTRSLIARPNCARSP